MRQYKHGCECSAEIGSVSAAMNVQAILAKAAIPSDVVKNESISKRGGCVYSVCYSCSQSGNVRAVLSASSVKVRAYNDQ